MVMYFSIIFHLLHVCFYVNGGCVTETCLDLVRTQGTAVLAVVLSPLVEVELVNEMQY
jgi:hypothetical protein